LSAVQAIAKENDALLIADEMLTGFGRTGSMWGCDHEPIVPDVMTVGKGMGGGFPVSGVISTQELMASKPFGNPSGSSSSYGGNPLAATAGLATLEVIVKDRLVANAKHVGAVMLKRLEAMKEKYPFVGDVRGRGLLLGIELVKDRQTKEPLSKPITQRLFQACLRRGLLAMCYSYNIRINPPLLVTEAQALEGLAILDEAFAELEKTGYRE
jgi:4-aminobutyrate aminotransferase-like enzyme